VGIAQLEEPALDLVLQAGAVLPRVEAARVLIVPDYALSEVGERAKGRTGRGEDAAAEWVVQASYAVM
jgi:hypothetical protein